MTTEAEAFAYTQEETELLIESYTDDLKEAKRREEIAVNALKKIFRQKPEVPGPNNQFFGKAFQKAYQQQQYNALVALGKLGYAHANQKGEVHVP